MERGEGDGVIRTDALHRVLDGGDGVPVVVEVLKAFERRQVFDTVDDVGDAGVVGDEGLEAAECGNGAVNLGFRHLQLHILWLLLLLPLLLLLLRQELIQDVQQYLHQRLRDMPRFRDTNMMGSDCLALAQRVEVYATLEIVVADVASARDKLLADVTVKRRDDVAVQRVDMVVVVADEGTTLDVDQVIVVGSRI
jgi:hypothetical protein